MPRRIAHVAQDIEAADQRAIDFVLAGHAPLGAAREELAQAEASHDEMRLAHAHAALAELNEGAILAAAQTVMRGLGFAPSDANRAVTSFSGGWRNRLALARALLRPADLLLLDEPTNHLDLDSVVWLEAWLRRQPATVLVISHDREFLDRVCETIWHVDLGGIRRYSGDYSAFEAAWLEQQKQQDAAAKAYARTAAHLQHFVDRFRAQATKARQAQSRLKMLERLTVVEPVRARREWRFEFPEPLRVPERLLDAEAMTLGYGERTVLAGITLTVRAGDRVGILGVNGAGKSTLVKSIAGEIAPRAGELRRGQGLAIGYFAQHQLDQLRTDETPLAHLRRLAPDAREQQLREFLGTYRFSGEMATVPDRADVRRRKSALCAGAARMAAAESAAARRTDQPSGHGDARSADNGAFVVRRGAVAGLARPPPAARRVRPALAGARRTRRRRSTATSMTMRRSFSRAGATERRRSSTPRPRIAVLSASRRRRSASAWPIRAARCRRGCSGWRASSRSISDQLRELDARLADPAFYHSGDDESVASTLKLRGELARRVDELETDWLAVTTELETMA